MKQLKKILRYLIDFQRSHFDWKLYSSFAIFMIIGITFNYTLDFEDSYLDPFFGQFLHWPLMLLWQGLPFLITCILIAIFTEKKGFLSEKRFWFTFFIGFGILAIDRTFVLHKNLQHWYSGVDYYFIKKCVSWSSSLFTVVIPLIILSKFLEKDAPQNKNYGLIFKKFDASPYFMILGITVIIIGIGSFMGDLQEYYPRYAFSKGNLFAVKHHFPKWVSMIIYELSYATDFINVELFFRGFLILAFGRWLGGYAVLAMASTYCFLHFGKPLPESISSIFGGYILGVIAYNNRNIWGGVIIHVGVAWAMELFGFLHRS